MDLFNIALSNIDKLATFVKAKDVSAFLRFDNRLIWQTVTLVTVPVSPVVSIRGSLSSNGYENFLPDWMKCLCRVTLPVVAWCSQTNPADSNEELIHDNLEEEVRQKRWLVGQLLFAASFLFDARLRQVSLHRLSYCRNTCQSTAFQTLQKVKPKHFSGVRVLICEAHQTPITLLTVMVKKQSDVLLEGKGQSDNKTFHNKTQTYTFTGGSRLNRTNKTKQNSYEFSEFRMTHAE